MRLQSFSVIFVIIIVPLILVLSYYLTLQIKTITNQNEYDNDLLSATYDAMSSFEMNTANEDLSSVSDSLRTIIEASCNVFSGTLSTNLGMSNASKTYIEPFIPALLYTLYDGYYIYSPTNVPDVLTDSSGNAVAVGDKGVEFDAGTYSYDVDNPSDTYLTLGDLGDSNASDYGQLLYRKAGTDGYTANIDEARLKTKNVLKSYMPYSAKYSQDDINVTIIYTLDNFVTIEGTIGNVYYTKSGYLIPTIYPDKTNPSDPDSATIKCSVNQLLTSYSQKQVKEYIEDGNPVTLTLDPNGSNIEIKVGGDALDPDDGNYKNLRSKVTDLNIRMDNLRNYQLQYNRGVRTLELNNAVIAALESLSVGATTDECILKLNEEIDRITNELNDIQYKLDDASAVEYYIESYIFSKWVKDNLGDLKEGSLIEISGQDIATINGTEDVIYKFKGRNTNVFEFKGSTQNGLYELPIDSGFVTHKINVIKNSIQYNLNMAMSTYNNTSASLQEYEMPVLDAAEWEKVLTNVSLVSFMQGYSSGLKTYNNYKIVTSSNNELTVSPTDIYYVKQENFNKEDDRYHKIDCVKLMNNDADTKYMSFRSKEVKYDKIYDKTTRLYKYDHKNFACYECINDGNYNKNNIFREGTDTEEKEKLKNLQTYYYIAVGKERNDIYKMNAVVDSQGYEIIYLKPTTLGASSVDIATSLKLKDVRKICITISPLKFVGGAPEPIINYRVKTTSTGPQLKDKGGVEEYAIYYNETTSTFEIDISPSDTSINGSNTSFKFDTMQFENVAQDTSRLSADGGLSKADNMNDVMKNHVLCVKVIYK